jgi:hypothetical protein
LPAPDPLQDVVTVIGSCVEELTSAGLHVTAALLSIAHLDLKARLHGFTEAELAAVAAIADHANQNAKSR